MATRSIDELSLLSTPFRSRLHQFMGSLTKKRIVLNWPKDKERLQRRLYKEDVHSDAQFLLYLADYFREIKPILIQSYREEYPEDVPTPTKLKGWMEDCAIASSVLGRKKERNVWLEMIRVFEWLMEANLIPINDKNALI
ncbi:hypothetical protein [Laceyella putida]|uniref:Uncharacterized protein n=1 Tax=Laceyella putida TaxID=110101 RepID=A0ABW2RHM2_9BACL